MSSDIIALIVILAIWSAWAFLDANLKHDTPQERSNLTMGLIKAHVRSWYVVPFLWLLYSQHMWNVYDHTPWPMSLIDKL